MYATFNNLVYKSSNHIFFVLNISLMCTGVLDPEELSIVNKGFKKYGSCLPGIQEDVWRSTESNSTVGSGTSSLSSLESDLLEEMRTSVHKLTDESDVATSSVKLLRKKRNQNFRSKCTPISLVKDYMPAHYDSA